MHGSYTFASDYNQNQKPAYYEQKSSAGIAFFFMDQLTFVLIINSPLYMNNNSTSFNSSPHAYSDIKRLLDELIKSNREIQKELKKFLPHATLLDGWFPATYVKEMLGISSSTLHRYMNDGTLPYSKIGFRTLFHQNDIRALLERNYRRGQ